MIKHDRQSGNTFLGNYSVKLSFESINKILVIHAGAIGDVMLATPIAKIIKQKRHQIRVSYWVDSSLTNLLSSSPFIDDVYSFSKRDSFLRQLKDLRTGAYDLIIDLSSSSRSKWLCLFSQVPVLRYKKQPMRDGKHFHATFNFIDTLGSAFPELALESTISGLADNDYYRQVMHDLFPTLVTDGHHGEEKSLGIKGREALLESNAKIAIVPGVGKFRPHRGWPMDYWLALCKDILQSTNCSLEFVGGRDEAELIQDLISTLSVSSRIGDFNPNATLVDTASKLKSCQLVISGDTGPAHLSVALGIPVLGIYGPTYLERSGPYGCGKEAVSNSQECRCQAQKICNLKPDQRGAGSCMVGIGPDLLMAKLKSILYY